jgi:hypothetical protein
MQYLLQHIAFCGFRKNLFMLMNKILLASRFNLLPSMLSCLNRSITRYVYRHIIHLNDFRTNEMD